MSTFAHGRGVLGTDYRPEEVLASTFIAASIPVWLFLLWNVSGLSVVAAGPPNIEKGTAIPMKVTPMIDMDSPLLKLGGGKKVKLPTEWEVAPPVVKQREAAAVVSPNAKDDPNAIPDRDLPIYDGGTAPDPDAEAVRDPEITDAGEPSDGNVNEGGGSAAGSPDGSATDPTKARAARFYHGRILAFLKAGFICPSLPEGAPKCSPSGSVTISGDLTVSGVSFSGCGVPEIDAAAQAAINAKKGQQIPPPPENHPELQPSSFSVTYVCK